MSDSPLKLLSPYEGTSLSTPNRVAMAPMTRNRAGESRTPNDLMATYYAQRSTAGLLVSESADVSPRAIGYPGTPGLYRRDQIEGWKRVVAAVREAQVAPAPFFCQLFHTGRVSHRSLKPDGSSPVAPSAVATKEVQLYTPEGMVPCSPPLAMSAMQIQETIQEYVQAAKGAIEAGFDGVEVNGGNGYLVDQFLRDATNRRTDGYGGDASRRVRFLVDLVDALSGAIGASRVAVRVSPMNPTNEVSDSDPVTLFTTVADALSGRGLAYLHVIENAAFATVTRKMRERYPGTFIVNDGYGREEAERAIQSGLADLVSFGKAFLANPDLPRRFAEGAPLNEPDMATFYGGTDAGYTDYPALQAVSK